MFNAQLQAEKRRIKEEEKELKRLEKERKQREKEERAKNIGKKNFTVTKSEKSSLSQVRKIYFRSNYKKILSLN